MENVLGKKFSFLTLLQFALPTMVMMIFMSFYSMVDGIFVSRLIGTAALSAVNIVYPFFNIMVALAIMLATGGSAIVATLMGEEKTEEAKKVFSLLIWLSIILGFCVAIFSLTFLDSIVRILGANDVIFQYCKDYAKIIAIAAPLAMLQMMFQYFFVTAGKPTYGLLATISGGVVNIVLDYIFIAHFKMGISGAALATAIGFSVPAFIGLLYFSFNKTNLLRLTKPIFSIKVILKSCSNGSSEMVTNLSVAVVGYLFNIIMMKNLGENGVAAITIVLYMEYFLTAMFLGYASGIAPVLSFNHGERNTKQIKKLFKISIRFLIGASLFVCILAQFIAPYVVGVFVSPGDPVYDLAYNGFKLFAIAYLFLGTNIFASAMFTAFSNGKISAFLSFLRSFGFIVIAFMTLPNFFGINGIWLAVPMAETCAIIVTTTCFIRYRKEYNYM